MSDETKPIQFNRSVEDDQSSFMSDKTKLIQFNDDTTVDRETVVTTMQV